MSFQQDFKQACFYFSLLNCVLYVESTFHFHSITYQKLSFSVDRTLFEMNPQRDLTEEQTSRSLVENARVQSSTNEVDPSTGREEQRNGAASSGASGSSGAELQRRFKVVRLSGNEHFSLVEVEDESKVICLIFPFPVDRTAQQEPGRKCESAVEH